MSHSIAGIILAGGLGTRLKPITDVVSKHLLPVYDKPMIYYPLSILMLAGIRDVFIVSSSCDIKQIKRVLHHGEHLGLRISYIIQDVPGGIPDAIMTCDDATKNFTHVCVVLGDNVIYGESFINVHVAPIIACHDERAHAYAYHVTDPQKYGVIEFDHDDRIVSLIEKPKNPQSNYAIIGMYVFPRIGALDVMHACHTLCPSSRNELEIVDLLCVYLHQALLNVSIIGRGTMWMDAGTFDDLHSASTFVSVVQRRQGMLIADIDQIARTLGYIT